MMTTPFAVTSADLQLTERVDQALQQFRLGLITAQERQAQTDKAFAIYRAGVNAGRQLALECLSREVDR
ncbi:TPA: hypothetical protein ACKQBR_002299 [Pseudomonas aeruginosa]|uniref:hypothetical protein n=2 Tax=Pseudomonas aeruginosa TaxID=287 RepID=UPI0013792E4D|nr:hypothetical protein [Pseudomonas aeruginosa]EKY0302526.1 hypothetical protein [Pseudomonas aeruginosa]MBH4280935.1 hypothetical protein [Pseudomonas aeruginosa]